VEFSFPVLDRFQGLIGEVDGLLGVELSVAFKDLVSQLAATKEHVECLTKAQADALVNSAMLMTELQEARAELESAHAATQTMNHTLERVLSEVRASEERFRLLSNTAPIGIFQIDSEDQCVYANAYLQQIFPVRAPAASEVDWRHWLQPEEREAVLTNWAQAAADRREFSSEFRVSTTDGADRWVGVCAKPLFSSDAQFSGYIGTLSDVTARKEIDQLKDDLVSTVSHELRTPLASLRGFVELLLQREFSLEKRAQFLTIIHDESLRLTRLVNDFLDLQRMASRQQAYAFETNAEPSTAECNDSSVRSDGSLTI
jgi:PAS domain S-box-containing protein